MQLSPSKTANEAVSSPVNQSVTTNAVAHHVQLLRSTGHTSSDTLHFSGERTMKLPHYVRKQVDFLTKTLGVPADTLISTASGLIPAARYFPSELPTPQFLVVDARDLEKLPLTEAAPPETPNKDRYFKALLTEQEFKDWQQGKVGTLSPKQTFVEWLREWVPMKGKVTFNDQNTRGSDEGVYHFLFSLIPLYTPFGIINHLRIKRHDKTRVFNGINLLYEATQKKLKNPNERLISYTVSTPIDENYRQIDSPTKEFHITQYNKIFAALQSS